jgi:hypothetical protein
MSIIKKNLITKVKQMRESFLFLFRRYFDKNRFDILVAHKTGIIGIQVYLGTTSENREVLEIEDIPQLDYEPE